MTMVTTGPVSPGRPLAVTLEVLLARELPGCDPWHWARARCLCHGITGPGRAPKEPGFLAHTLASPCWLGAHTAAWQVLVCSAESPP